MHPLSMVAYDHFMWKQSTADKNAQLESQSQLLGGKTSPSVYEVVGEKTRRPLNVPIRNGCDIQGCVTGMELV